jgi:hypothetical protein
MLTIRYSGNFLNFKKLINPRFKKIKLPRVNCRGSKKWDRRQNGYATDFKMKVDAAELVY